LEKELQAPTWRGARDPRAIATTVDEEGAEGEGGASAEEGARRPRRGAWPPEGADLGGGAPAEGAARRRSSWIRPAPEL